MVAETSDAAYEKRHRKGEISEKKQRLRERDQLKQEHYKLKERIEQLRAMDGSAFMTLPASAFTPPPQEIADDIERTNSPYVVLDSGLHPTEGERRREEMLDIALKLEKRYSYLVPPRKITEASSNVRDTDSRDEVEIDTERDPGALASKIEKLRAQSVKHSASSTRAHSPATSRLLLSRKSLSNASTPIPKPIRPAASVRDYRTDISASAESSRSMPSIGQKGRSSSPPIVDHDIPKDDRQPSQLRPQWVQQDVIFDIRFPGSLVVQQSPLTIREGTQSSEDVSLKALNGGQSIDIEAEVPQRQSELSHATNHIMQQMRNVDLADRELGKVPSDARNLGSTSQPLRKKLKSRKKNNKEESVRNLPLNEIVAEMEMGPLPEIRVQQGRYEQEDVAGPSRITEEHLDVVSDTHLEKVSSQIRFKKFEPGKPKGKIGRLRKAAAGQEKEPFPETKAQQGRLQQDSAAGLSTETDEQPDVASDIRPEEIPDSELAGEHPQKRKRGKPRKIVTAHGMELLPEFRVEEGGAQQEVVASQSRMIEERLDPEVSTKIGVMDPVLPEPPQKRKRPGRPRKNVEPIPEIVAQKWGTSQQDIAGPSRMIEQVDAVSRLSEVPAPIEVTDFSVGAGQPPKKRGRKTLTDQETGEIRAQQPEALSGIRLRELTDLISLTEGPPAKRRRKNEVDLDPESISAEARSHSLSDVVAAMSATSLFMRGKAQVQYVDSRTGHTIRTPSLLLIACVKGAEKINSRRARDNIAFGAPTPDFGKGSILDYELEEEILYGRFTDNSLNASGNAVITVEHERLEKEKADLSYEDNDETEDEEPSSGRDHTIENRRTAPEVFVEPQIASHRGMKPIQAYHSALTREYTLVYKGSYGEQLVASPETEPMPELPPGVRPREPSRSVWT